MNINGAALGYLASRSRTVKELERYLLRKNFPEEEISALLADFIEYGYLDDSRYCLAYFDYAFGRGKGKRRVFAELQEKGVDPQTIEIAFEEYGPAGSEEERAWIEAEKILRLSEIGEDEPVPEKVRGRIARRLQTKGYSSDVIYKVIGGMKR